MIRNVVIHVSNEQPLLADLFGPPDPGDVGLVCTNVRMLDGKRPIFIDATDSTFFFPYLHLRFIEIPARELHRHRAEGGSGPGPELGPVPDDPSLRLPVLAEPRHADDSLPDADPDLDIDLAVDEGFLQRIRDI